MECSDVQLSEQIQRDLLTAESTSYPEFSKGHQRCKSSLKRRAFECKCMMRGVLRKAVFSCRTIQTETCRLNPHRRIIIMQDVSMSEQAKWSVSPFRTSEMFTATSG